MSAGAHFEERYGDQSWAALLFYAQRAAAGGDDVHAWRKETVLRWLGRWEHSDDIPAMQAGASPEIPTVRVADHVSQLYVAVRGRFLHATLPAGNGHGGEAKLLAQVSLAEFHPSSEIFNPLRPLRTRLTRFVRSLTFHSPRHNIFVNWTVTIYS